MGSEMCIRDSIQGTPCTQDTRFGVWFEPLLPRLCPLREEPEGIL